jgi:hypothetical protein
MADKRGSQRISSMRQTQSAPNRLSVETCLKENPLLKSAGVTLEHFNFTFVKRSSSAQRAPSGAAAPSAEQAGRNAAALIEEEREQAAKAQSKVRCVELAPVRGVSDAVSLAYG